MPRLSFIALLIAWFLVSAIAASSEPPDCERYDETMRYLQELESVGSNDCVAINGNLTIHCRDTSIDVYTHDSDGTHILFSSTPFDATFRKLSSVDQLAIAFDTSSSANSLYFIDWRNPQVVAVTVADTCPEITRGLRRYGTKAYVAAENGGVWIYSYDSSGAAHHESIVATVGAAIDLAIADGILVVAEHDAVRVYDISNTELPILLDQLQVPAIGGYEPNYIQIEYDGQWFALHVRYGATNMWCYVITMEGNQLFQRFELRSYGLCEVHAGLLYTRERFGSGTLVRQLSDDALIEIAYLNRFAFRFAISDNVMILNGSEQARVYDTRYDRQVPKAATWSMVESLGARVLSVTEEYLTAGIIDGGTTRIWLFDIRDPQEPVLIREWPLYYGIATICLLDTSPSRATFSILVTYGYYGWKEYYLVDSRSGSPIIVELPANGQMIDSRYYSLEYPTSGQLTCHDISDPTAIVMLGVLNLNVRAFRPIDENNVLAEIDGVGLVRVDFSIPTLPVVHETGLEFSAVEFRDRHGDFFLVRHYVNGHASADILDVSDLDDIHVAWSSGSAVYFAGDANGLVALCSNNRLTIVDLGVPRQPVVVSEYYHEELVGDAEVWTDGIIYLRYMNAVDVNDPATPAFLGRALFRTDGGCDNNIYDSGDYIVTRAGAYRKHCASVVAVESVPQGDSEMPTRSNSLSIAPNPFNPRTTILLNMEERDRVTLAVYDLRGRRVAALHTGELGPGEHQFLWNGKDSRGFDLASGTYLVRFVSGRQIDNKKMVLIR